MASNMPRCVFLFALCLIPALAPAQVITPVDSLGARFETDLLSPGRIAVQLCTDLETETDKARAIFSWLAHHITYDLEAAQNSRPERILYRSKEELQQILARRKQERMRNALRERKGICEHYAQLFVAMCEAVGLQAGTVDGYVVHHPDKMGRQPLSSNHVWNWVRLNGQKKLVDVTYAAGATDWSGSAFRQNYDPVWFAVPPKIMIQTHFPERPQDQLLEQPLSGSEFAALPFFFARSAWYQLTEWTPSRGIIRRSETDTLVLQFGRKPRSVFVIIDQLARDVPVQWKGNEATLLLDSALLQSATYLQIGVEDADQRLRTLMAWKLQG